MFNLLNTFKRYWIAFVLCLSLVAGSIATVQSYRVSTKNDQIKKLSMEVAALKRSNVLMQRLQQNNARIEENKNYVLEGLRSAEGYDQDLPFGIRTLLDGVQQRDSIE